MAKREELTCCGGYGAHYETCPAWLNPPAPPSGSGPTGSPPGQQRRPQTAPGDK